MEMEVAQLSEALKCSPAYQTNVPQTITVKIIIITAITTILAFIFLLTVINRAAPNWAEYRVGQ